MLLLKITNNSTNLSINYFIKIICKLYEITLKKKSLFKKKFKIVKLT